MNTGYKALFSRMFPYTRRVYIFDSSNEPGLCVFSQAAFHVGPGWAPVGQSWAPNGPRVGLTGAHLGMLLGLRHFGTYLYIYKVVLLKEFSAKLIG